MKKDNVKRLTESAIMIAIATVLSMIKILHLPYGGSVTVASMLPVIIIAYRYGFGWGLLTGAVFGIIEQLLGLNNLSYVTTWQSILAVILLDYVVAYMMTAFGAGFRKKMPQPAALLLGSLIACILRYICHVISGATVWAGISVPTAAALIYSLGYNATFMIPETIVTMVVAYYLGSVLDFRKANIGPFAGKTGKLSVYAVIGGVVIAAAVIADVAIVFAKLQNGDTGSFDITGLGNANWKLVGIVTGIGAVLAAVMLVLDKRQKTA